MISGLSQIARFYGIPTRNVGLTDASSVDLQTGAESAFNLRIR